MGETRYTRIRDGFIRQGLDGKGVFDLGSVLLINVFTSQHLSVLMLRPRIFQGLTLVTVAAIVLSL
jgi:hypothetical protein